MLKQPLLPGLSTCQMLNTRRLRSGGRIGALGTVDISGSGEASGAGDASRPVWRQYPCLPVDNSPSNDGSAYHCDSESAAREAVERSEKVQVQEWLVAPWAPEELQVVTAELQGW